MEKEVAIIHTDFTLKGGGERVCVSLIEALNRRGITPEVYTFHPVNKVDLGTYYGKSISFKTHLLPFNLKKFGISTVVGFRSSLLMQYDLIINTGTYIQPFFKFLIKRFLCYVYTASDIFYIPDKYKRNLVWRLYLAPRQIFKKKIISSLTKDELIAVSNFTKMRINKYWGKESTTVYPPVDLEKFSEANTNNVRDGVITIGRFAPEKNHKTQLEIAKKLPTIPFRLCGSANTPAAKNMLQEIIINSEEMDLSNMEFYPNLSLKKMIKLISESKYFLHTAVDEDFGLTTCEAISGGCIPLVHNSGGSKETVPFRELRFNDVLEAENRFRTLYQCNTNDILDKLQTHINNNFSDSIFQKHMMSQIFK